MNPLFAVASLELQYHSQPDMPDFDVLADSIIRRLCPMLGCAAFDVTRDTIRGAPRGIVGYIHRCVKLTSCPPPGSGKSYDQVGRPIGISVSSLNPSLMRFSRSKGVLTTRFVRSKHFSRRILIIV